MYFMTILVVLSEAPMSHLRQLHDLRTATKSLYATNSSPTIYLEPMTDLEMLMNHGIDQLC